MGNLPDFHDGYLDGLFASDSDARIFLRTVDGQAFTFVLRNVEALRADNFRLGNIIFELNLLTPEQIDESFLCQAYEYSEQVKERLVLAGWKVRAAQKGLSGLEITTSYGCELRSIYAAHELSEGHAIPTDNKPRR
ncbi:MAG TPA: hypothetical protein VMH04_06390 [Candidatus Solibacter sp.]|nr:hypothetical protein [Candidatus Solibacter sp.]